jgi:hypothetical protein
MRSKHHGRARGLLLAVAAAITACLLSSPAAHAADASFSLKSFGAGATANGVDVADFDLDGRPDAMVTLNADLVQILLNQPGGTMTRESVDTAAGPGAVSTVADVNDDGKPDIVSVGESGIGTVLLGNGDGSFSLDGSAGFELPPNAVAPDAAPPSDVDAADLNGDNRDDVVVSVGWGPVVFFGESDGTFGPTDYLGPDAGEGLPRVMGTEIADFNGDGKPDVAGIDADFFSPGVSIWLSDEEGVDLHTQEMLVDGGFQPQTPTGAIAVGDLNGDGHQDVAIGAPTGTSLYVWFGTGTGSLTPEEPPAQSLPGVATSLSTGDVNDDGILDLIFGFGDGLESEFGMQGQTVFYLGQGNGQFNAIPGGTIPGPVAAVAYIDLNPGGLGDAVTGPGTGSSSIQILTNTSQADPEASPQAFGPTVIEQASAPQTITVENEGYAPTQLGQGALAGANPGDFSIESDDCSGERLNTHETCTVTVTFEPGATGPRAASLKFPSSSGTTPFVISLQGTGELPPPPNTAITSAPAAHSGDTSPTMVFTSSGSSTGFECSLNQGAWTPCTSPTDYQLVSGFYEFQVRAVGLGGPDPTPAQAFFTIDPGAPVIGLSGPTVTADRTPTFTVIASESLVALSCSLDGAAFTPCSNPYTTPTLAPGTHTLAVRGSDAAGNVGQSATESFQVLGAKKKKKKKRKKPRRR